jgi:hypothetical protein
MYGSQGRLEELEKKNLMKISYTSSGTRNSLPASVSLSKAGCVALIIGIGLLALKDAVV